MPEENPFEETLEVTLPEEQAKPQPQPSFKKSPTNAQLDAAVEKILTQLQTHEQEWFREIAKENNFPLWVVMLAQWRKTNEYGEAAALLVDADWQQMIDEFVTKRG